jgi:hypothetical protein
MRISVFLALGALLSGCAFTVEEKALNYAFSGPATLQPVVAPVATLQIGEVTDGRNVANPRLLMNKRNLNGDVTSGGWEAERPLADILRDALRQGATQVRLPLADSGARYVLAAQLLSYDTQVVMGMWSGTMNSKLMVKATLSDANTRTVAWRDTIIGTASITEGDFVTLAFARALDDVVAKLYGDSTFVAAFRANPSLSTAAAR